jgi:hypothetical protein
MFRYDAAPARAALRNSQADRSHSATKNTVIGPAEPQPAIIAIDFFRRVRACGGGSA